MREFDAALFDVDGTLLDTKQFIFQAFKHTLLNHHGMEATWEQVAPVLGKPLIECYRILATLDKVKCLCDAHKSFQQDNLHLSAAFPNTKSTLARLRDEGVRIAAVTTRTTHNLVRTLKLAGIYDYMEAIVTGDDVTHHKPHPESIFKALDAVRVKPNRAVMIGDTEVDVLAGRNAGTRTIGVTYGFHGPRIAEAKPDFVVDDISSVVPIIVGR